MSVFQPVVFFVCVITSIVCMALLIRGWRRTGTRLLLWSALCFVGLAINNLLVFIDLVILPDTIDLLPLRHIASLSAVSVLIWGFIWEAD
jgi:hypothetical protein